MRPSSFAFTRTSVTESSMRARAIARSSGRNRRSPSMEDTGKAASPTIVTVRAFDDRRIVPERSVMRSPRPAPSFFASALPTIASAAPAFGRRPEATIRSTCMNARSRSTSTPMTWAPTFSSPRKIPTGSESRATAAATSGSASRRASRSRYRWTRRCSGFSCS